MSSSSRLPVKPDDAVQGYIGARSHSTLSVRLGESTTAYSSPSKEISTINGHLAGRKHLHQLASSSLPGSMVLQRLDPNMVRRSHFYHASKHGQPFWQASSVYMSSLLLCWVLPSPNWSSGVICEQSSQGLSSRVACMQAAAEPPPAAQQPPPQNASYQSSERSTGSHASDHQHSGSGSRLSSEPDSSPGSRERHVNGAAPDAGLLHLAAAAEQGAAAASPGADQADGTAGMRLCHQRSVYLVALSQSHKETPLASSGMLEMAWKERQHVVECLVFFEPLCSTSAPAEETQMARLSGHNFRRQRHPLIFTPCCAFGKQGMAFALGGPSGDVWCPG